MFFGICLSESEKEIVSIKGKSYAYQNTVEWGLNKRRKAQEKFENEKIIKTINHIKNE